MNELAVYISIFIVAVFLSSISQIMLKTSAKKTYKSVIKEYLNPFVILAYIMFFGCTFITIYALKVIPLTYAPILEATGYIFIAVLSRFVLKEKVSKRKMLGFGIIVFGVLVFVL